MSSLSVPTAIVAGLALVGVFAGLGLYFGLRSRSGAQASRDAARGPAGGATVTSALEASAAPIAAAPARTAARRRARCATSAGRA